MSDITEIFYEAGNFFIDFAQKLEQKLLQSGTIKRKRSSSLCKSEIMTILIWFHQFHDSNFKHFYEHMLFKHRDQFPGMPSNQRFYEIYMWF